MLFTKLLFKLFIHLCLIIWSDCNKEIVNWKMFFYLLMKMRANRKMEGSSIHLAKHRCSLRRKSKFNQFDLENFCLRFPVLCDEVLNELNPQSLGTCKELSNFWDNQINESRIYWIKQFRFTLKVSINIKKTGPFSKQRHLWKLWKILLQPYKYSEIWERKIGKITNHILRWLTWSLMNNGLHFILPQCLVLNYSKKLHLNSRT